MSITFYLENHYDRILIKNSNFNQHEAEDYFYNPRTIKEPIYPEVNFSNLNAILFLRMLEIISKENNSDEIYSGKILNSNLEKIIQKLNQLEIEMRNSGKENSEYFIRRINEFDRLARYAMYFKDNILWD